MSIWKSPVFYLGILLLIVVGSALAAPFAVDWNSYRDNLERYGHKLTGRDVAISGPIYVRLFPWPRLSVQDVSVGNPPELSGPPMIEARNMTFELALAGLFSGEIRVETISIDRPVINVARFSDGRGNWIFKPDEAISHSRLLDQVKLEQIKITDGILHLQDDEHHLSQTMTGLNAELSAPAVEGPWRMRANANENGTQLDVVFNSAEWKNDQPLRYNGKISPQDGVLPALLFDGSQLDGIFKGKIRLEPVVSDDGRSSLDGRFKPLQMQADVEASDKLIALNKIHIVPADAKDSGTLIEGSAKIDLKDGVNVQVNLSSPRVNLDALAGDQSLRVWRAGGVMAVLNTVMRDFPQKFDLSGNFDVAALSIAGENLENVVLKTSAEQNAIRVQDFTANLPGRSRMKFSGLVFPGEKTAELGGSLALESNDARAFASWLWPEGKAQIAKSWTGSRGRLKMQTDVSWSGLRFGLQNTKYDLDGEQGGGDFTVQLGGLPAIDLRVKAKSIDVDNYFLVNDTGLSKLIPIFQNENGIEKRFIIQSDKIHLNGVDAQDVNLDFASGSSGFEVRKLAIGSIEGARVEGQGLVLHGPDGPSGDVKLSVSAANPRGLLRLLGITPKTGEARWVNVLGQTDMQGIVSVKPGTSEPSVTYDISGKSGPLQIAASGDVKDVAKGLDAKFGVSSEVSSHDDGDILRLVGLQPRTKSENAGKLKLTAVGSQGDGYKLAVSAEVLGGKLAYEGSFKTSIDLALLDGALLATADDGHAIGVALGLPIENPLAGAIKLSSLVKTQNSQIQFNKIGGLFAGQKLTGDGSIGAKGELNADLALTSLDLKQLLASVFMRWQGQVPKLDEAFDSPITVAKSGEIWLRPDTLQTGLGDTLREAVIGLAFDHSGRSLTIASAGADGEPFKLDLTVKPRAERYLVSGSLQIALDLERSLKVQNGGSIASGKALLEASFNGEGRSPLAAASSLNGNGSLALDQAGLKQISPQNFYPKLTEIKDAAALQKAFEDLLTGPGFTFGKVSQQILIHAGTARVQSITVNTDAAAIRITPSINLTEGTLDADVSVSAAHDATLPALHVTYSGSPLALLQRKDTSAISAKLGYAMIAKDMAELDRVQKEQAKIVADEEAQRKADENKFAAFQAQRVELRLRQRELRVFAQQRELDSALKKAEMAKILSNAAVLNKTEIPKFLRQLPLH
jgi:uncharacterized protein involved in outer membrane biogenesis